MKTTGPRQRIGTRLVATHATIFGFVLLIFSVGVTLVFSNSLKQGLHRELGREFEVIESLIEANPSRTGQWAGDDQDEEADYEGEAIAAEVWSSSRKLLFRTKAAERWAHTIGSVQDWDGAGFDLVDAGDERVHVLQGQHAVGDRHFIIRVLRSDTLIHEAVATLVWTLAAAFFLALLFIVATSQRLVRRLFLMPLARMADHAAQISVERSGAPMLPIANPNDELGQLGAVFNRVFKSFDAAVVRNRRFSADASHELRTPLTIIRSVAEVCLRVNQTPDAYRDTIGSILEEVEGLTRLLDSLLLLSQADDEKKRLSKSTVSIVALVEEVAEVMSALCEPKDQTISVIGETALKVNADSALLKVALVNLVDNALKFGSCESIVEVRVSRIDDEICIDVHNDGDTIAAEHRDRIFDRFYRIDCQRSEPVTGTGLGLSVAKWAVEAHSGTLLVEDESRSGVTFRIRLPAVSDRNG